MKLVKSIRKRLGKWVLIPMTKYYLSKERHANVDGIQLTIPAGVFHPTLFTTTKLLLEFISNESISGLRALELGAGSGLLAVAMVKHGAFVTASDINPVACAAIQANARKNATAIEVFHSDLFDAFDGRVYDLVLINPPFYPKDPQNDPERAWFCGNDYGYFKKLYQQLTNFLTETGYAVMILSEDCNIDIIQHLAVKDNYKWQQVKVIRRAGEWFYLIKLSGVHQMKEIPC